jgi:hypothetical protein
VLIASLLLTLVVDLPFQDIKKIVTERDGMLPRLKQKLQYALHQYLRVITKGQQTQK